MDSARRRGRRRCPAPRPARQNPGPRHRGQEGQLGRRRRLGPYRVQAALRRRQGGAGAPCWTASCGAFCPAWRSETLASARAPRRGRRPALSRPAGPGPSPGAGRLRTRGLRSSSDTSGSCSTRPRTPTPFKSSSRCVSRVAPSRPHRGATSSSPRGAFVLRRRREAVDLPLPPSRHRHLSRRTGGLRRDPRADDELSLIAGSASVGQRRLRHPDPVGRPSAAGVSRARRRAGPPRPALGR